MKAYQLIIAAGIGLVSATSAFAGEGDRLFWTDLIVEQAAEAGPSQSMAAVDAQPGEGSIYVDIVARYGDSSQDSATGLAGRSGDSYGGFEGRGGYQTEPGEISLYERILSQYN